MSNQAKRELMLEEWVNGLPEGHRARVELAALKRENKQLVRALGHSRYGGHRHLALGCTGCDLITAILTAEEREDA